MTGGGLGIVGNVSGTSGGVGGDGNGSGSGGGGGAGGWAVVQGSLIGNVEISTGVTVSGGTGGRALMLLPLTRPRRTVRAATQSVPPPVGGWNGRDALDQMDPADAAGGASGSGEGGDGGAGGGGFHFGSVTLLLPFNVGANAVVQAGAGGAGGDSVTGADGDGGAGGTGIFIITSDGPLNLLAGASVAGGAGGASGGGTGGEGGDGVFQNGGSITLAAGSSIRGGNGGSGTVQGDGGFGVLGSNLSIVSAGLIAGGLSGGGERQDALRFTGGANSLQLNTGWSLTGAIQIAAGSLTFAQPTDVALSNEITGGGGVTKTGAGTLTLLGGNSWSGTTTISAGALQIGNGGAFGTLGSGNVVNNASLIVNRSDFVVFSTGVSGSGSLTKRGAGSMLLTGANSFAGGLVIEQGAVEAGSDSNIGTGAVTLNGGAFLATSSSTFTCDFVLGTNGGTLGSTPGLIIPNYAGVISGAGNLTIQAGSITTLSGANTYSGSTTVTSFALQILGGAAIPNSSALQLNAGTQLFVGASETIGSLSGSGSVALGANTLTAGANGASTTYSGVMSGSGAFTKQGAGTLTFTGTNTYSGLTTVAGGTLLVNGAVPGAINVGAGARLGGTGALGPTTVNGTYAPGNSVGTQNVTGPLVFNPGSVFEVEFQGATADRVNVTGSASLAGTLRLIGLGGPYSFGSPYTILTTTTGYTGTFSPIDNLLALTASVTYAPNLVTVALTPSSLTPIITGVPGATVNQRAVAGGIDAAIAGGATPGALMPLFTLTTPEAIRAGLDDLSGQIHAAGAPAAFETATPFLAAMLASRSPSDPVQAGDAVRPLPASGGDGFGVWAASLGAAGNFERDPVVGTFARTDEQAGFAAGLDIGLGGYGRAGVALHVGEAREEVSGGRGERESDVVQAGVHLAGARGAWRTGAALAFGLFEVETRRDVPVLALTNVTAAFDAEVWSGRVEAAWDGLEGRGFMASPFGALQAARYGHDGYVESSAAGGLTIASDTQTVARGELGFELSTGGGWGRASLRTAWAHYLERDADLTARLTSLPGSTFTVTGAEQDANAALIGAGVQLAVSESVSVGLRADGEVSANVSAISGALRIGMTF